MDTSIRPVGLHILPQGVYPEPTLFTGGIPEYGKERTDLGSTTMIQLDEEQWVETKTIKIIAVIIIFYVLVMVYVFRERVFI